MRHRRQRRTLTRHRRRGAHRPVVVAETMRTSADCIAISDGPNVVE
ncbi:hypothetical protein [Saccharopolyspora sp. ASAGF58]|nr:hypothetical protein [Saccharopolyspora sp. ASAGF58]